MLPYRWFIVCLMCWCGCDEDESQPDATVDAATEVDAASEIFDSAQDDSSLLAPDAMTVAPVCNGQLRCDATFGTTIVAATHLSAATTAAAWQTTAQNLSIHDQMSSDALALTLEVFEVDAEMVVCNKSCSSGSVVLDVVLDDVHSFLTANTATIVTLFIEANVSAARLLPALRGSNVATRFYAHPDDRPWPTLGQLIADDRRVVVFGSTVEEIDDVDGGSGGDDLADDVDFFHILNRWVAQTRSDATVLGTIDCRIVAGDPEAPFLMLHQHISDVESGAPSPELALMANAESVIEARFDTCATLHGHMPSFVVLDFFELGDALRVIQRINRDGS